MPLSSICFPSVPISSLKFINISNSELKHWYSSTDLCMMTSSQANTKRVYFGEDYAKCLKLRKPHEEATCEATILCQFAPNYLYQRIDGYDTDSFQKQQKLLDMFINLNKTGRSLFFIGDSITRGIISGLRCALKKVDNKIWFDPPLVKEKFGHSSTVVYIPLTVKDSNRIIVVTSEIHFFAVWSPYLPELHGVVTKAVASVLERSETKGLVVLANIGLHERTAERHVVHLENLFSWAQSDKFGDMAMKNNSFFYRETNAQHFPNSSAGYYAVWMGKNKMGLGQGYNRTCASFDLENDARHYNANWRLQSETTALTKAQQYLHAGKTKTKINWISFLNVSSTAHSVHPSSELSHERYHFDCSHYCGNQPLLLQTIYYQMYSHI